MKNFTLTAFLFFFFSVGAFAQQRTTAEGEINFDYPPISSIWIKYDATHTNNVWQIGKPDKTVFKSARSAPNCIVTDTLNPYPINDTSVFIIGQITQSWYIPGAVWMVGYYQVNSDTITDYGKIEISPDNGKNWIDILEDSLYHFPKYGNDKPILSGNSGGWKGFGFEFGYLADSFKPQPWDTVLIRFSFISDSIQANKDGLMFDDLYFEDFYDAVPNLDVSKFTSTISPNPSSTFINISFETISSHSYSLSVYDCSGRIIRRMEKIKDHKLTVTTNDLPPGMYHYTIRDEQDGKYSDGKFVVVH